MNQSEVTEITEITEPSDSQGWLPPAPAEIPTAERAPRRRWLPATLAGRLVVGVVSLVLVVVVLSGLATYALFRPFLLQRLNQQVSTIASGNANSVATCVLNGFGRCPLGSTASGTGAAASTVHEWFVTYDTNGQVVFSVEQGVTHLSALSLSPTDVGRVMANPSKVRTVTTTDGQRLHIVAKVVPRTALGTLVVVTGLSTDEVSHTLGRLLVLEVAIGIVAVLLAAALTTWGVRVGLRPLRRVTRTAQEVTAELGPDGAGLERRVPNADPYTEVGEVASSVNTLLSAVQNEFAARVRSEDRMRQFLADASHELRTPLTSIRGYAELSRLQGQSSNDADDPMRRIEVEGTRMSRLVEDLLVLARGDDKSGEARRDRIGVDSLLNDAMASSHAAHPERNYLLGEPSHAVVLGDRDQLLRLLLNLLNNAAVHTAPDKPIRLEALQGHTAAGAAVALRVIDGGPGLSPEEAAHVFERFWRADKARSRAKGGSGLGMAIVAQIAEAHGGEVSFESSVESGTRVTVTLPLFGSSDPPQPAAKKSSFV